MAQTTGGKRTILTVRVRRPDAPPSTYRFHASKWQRIQATVAAGTKILIVLDRELLGVSGDPVLIIIKSTVEGVQWWKVSAAAPAVGDSPVLPKRELRPFEITDDKQWTSAIRPAIVVDNVTAIDAKIDVLYARS